MFKELLKKKYKKFAANTYIMKFGKLVAAENLWYFNRESVARGIALGVACSWIPLPFHTVIAIFFAILIDCNIPLVAIGIWVANPLTMPFMYYFAYQLGAALLNVSMVNVHFHFTVKDMEHVLDVIWQPFLIGCLICGLVSGVLTYLLVHLIWPNINHKFDL